MRAVFLLWTMGESVAERRPVKREDQGASTLGSQERWRLGLVRDESRYR